MFVLTVLAHRQVSNDDDAKDTASAEVLVAPPTPGDLALIELSSTSSSPVHIRRHSYLASSPAVHLSTDYTRGGLGFSIRQWWMPLRVTGEGHVAVHAPHSIIHKLSLKQDEEYLVNPR